MNYPLYIARRLSLQSSAKGGSPAVAVAACAVALSLMVMIASIAVVKGFKNEIARKVTGFNADIQVYAAPDSPSQTNVIVLNPALSSIVGNIPEASAAELQVSVPAVFKTPDDFKGIYLRSLSDSTTMAFIARNMEEGSLPKAGSTETVISRIMARQLGVRVGDRLDTYFFSDDIRVRPLAVCGIYNSHFDSYDDVTAYAPLAVLQKVSGLSPSQGSSVKISVKDFGKVEETAASLKATLNNSTASGELPVRYTVTTALQSGAAYFQWLALLDTNVAVILILMIAVGCVTLTGGMLLIILDKRRIIGLLKALGTPSKAIRSIFVIVALKVALIGMAIGNVLAIGVLAAQQKWHFLHLDPNTYYIDFVPVSIDPLEILLLNIGVLAIACIALILPSRFIAGISPAQTMRFE